MVSGIENRGGGIRRAMRGVAPVSRSAIEKLVTKIDVIEYGHGMRGLSPSEQCLRNKALISLLYLSARRISEIVGRTYKRDVYEGVLTSDFTLSTLRGEQVLIMRCRILKKWQRKIDRARVYPADVVMSMGDTPFIQHVLDWRDHQLQAHVEKYMPISRVRAYQIIQQVDPLIVGPHWFRHQRLSHLADYLSPYELNERIGFWESLDPAIAYFHGRMGVYLDALKQSREDSLTM